MGKGEGDEVEDGDVEADEGEEEARAEEGEGGVAEGGEVEHRAWFLGQVEVAGSCWCCWCCAGGAAEQRGRWRCRQFPGLHDTAMLTVSVARPMKPSTLMAQGNPIRGCRR